MERQDLEHVVSDPTGTRAQTKNRDVAAAVGLALAGIAMPFYMTYIASPMHREQINEAIIERVSYVAEQGQAVASGLEQYFGRDR